MQPPLLNMNPLLQPVQVEAEEQLAQLDLVHAKQDELLTKYPELQTLHWLGPRQEKQLLTLQMSQLLPLPPLLAV